jgi:hypothetical protein
MFEVVFLLTEFVLPWGEAWFVDFRVLPLESKASKLFFSKAFNDSSSVQPYYVPY